MLTSLTHCSPRTNPCTRCAQLFSLAQHYVATQPDYAALTHPNLQIDNGFYWRDEAGALQVALQLMAAQPTLRLFT